MLDRNINNIQEFTNNLLIEKIFEFNDEITKKDITSNLNMYCNNIEPKYNFKVVCNGYNNELNVDIYFQTKECTNQNYVEWDKLQFITTPTGIYINEHNY